LWSRSAPPGMAGKTNAPPAGLPTPFLALRFLYLGTSDVGREADRISRRDLRDRVARGSSISNGHSHVNVPC